MSKSNISDISEEELIRIGKATMDGWSFADFKFKESENSRHTVHIQDPEDDGWICHKVDAYIKVDWVHALLNEANVPKYNTLSMIEKMDILASQNGHVL